MPAQTRRIASAICMFLVAICIQRASTLGWGEALGADGSRYRLSPIGVMQDPGSGPGGGPRASCRWWPPMGERALCAVREGGGDDFGHLRRAYPLLQVALWCAVGALLLQALRLPRPALVHVLLAAAVGGMVALALRGVAQSGPRALELLAPLDVTFRGVGFVLAVLATALAALSALLLVERSPRPMERVA